VLSPAAAGANFYTKLTNADYRLGFDGTNYTLTRLTDNVVWTNTDRNALSTTVAGSEGFSLAISAGMAAGDTFLVQPTKAAARNLTVNPSVAADARLIAAAMPVRTSTGSTNTGSGVISEARTLQGFGAPALPAAGVTLTYNSAGNTLGLSGVPAGARISVTASGVSTVYDPGASIPYSSGMQISFAGAGFQISGNLNNGDTFALLRTASGVSDGRNSLALGLLQSQNTMSGKTASFQSAYAQLVSDNGNKTREIEVRSSAQAALLKQSTDARDALSGVNLDEEAANLMRYQQAYQASAKMLDVGNKLFDALLGIVS
jgi:flagellar hook-associated protein 1